MKKSAHHIKAGPKSALLCIFYKRLNPEVQQLIHDVVVI